MQMMSYKQRFGFVLGSVGVLTAAIALCMGTFDLVQIVVSISLVMLGAGFYLFG